MVPSVTRPFGTTMPTMPYLSRIAAHFNQHVAHWGIQLPPADLAQRRRGQLSQSGWSIGYLFGANERGDYLNYYAHHPVSGDEHRPAVRQRWAGVPARPPVGGSGPG